MVHGGGGGDAWWWWYMVVVMVVVVDRVYVSRCLSDVWWRFRNDWNVLCLLKCSRVEKIWKVFSYFPVYDKTQVALSGRGAGVAVWGDSDSKGMAVRHAD